MSKRVKDNFAALLILSVYRCSVLCHDEKPEILKEYLDRFKLTVQRYFPLKAESYQGSKNSVQDSFEEVRLAKIRVRLIHNPMSTNCANRRARQATLLALNVDYPGDESRRENLQSLRFRNIGSSTESFYDVYS